MTIYGVEWYRKNGSIKTVNDLMLFKTKEKAITYGNIELCQMEKVGCDYKVVEYYLED